MPEAKVFVIYYSPYGQVRALAEALKNAVEKSGKVSTEVYQFPETLSEEERQKLEVPKQLLDHPLITPDKLKEADGFLFGFKTNNGTAPKQVKEFFDSTADQWAEGALIGKPAGIFVATATQKDGQEMTALALMPYLAHQGLLFIPLGFKSPLLSDVSKPRGGSPWGAGTITNDKSKPTEQECEIAFTQGEEFAKVVIKLIGKTKQSTENKEEKVGLATTKSDKEVESIPNTTKSDKEAESATKSGMEAEPDNTTKSDEKAEPENTTKSKDKVKPESAKKEQSSQTPSKSEKTSIKTTDKAKKNIPKKKPASSSAKEHIANANTNSHTDTNDKSDKKKKNKKERMCIIA